MDKIVTQQEIANQCIKTPEELHGKGEHHPLGVGSKAHEILRKNYLVRDLGLYRSKQDKEENKQIATNKYIFLAVIAGVAILILYFIINKQA